jgi:hypothetical protein
LNNSARCRQTSDAETQSFLFKTSFYCEEEEEMEQEEEEDVQEQEEEEERGRLAYGWLSDFMLLPSSEISGLV